MQEIYIHHIYESSRGMKFILFVNRNSIHKFSPDLDPKKKNQKAKRIAPKGPNNCKRDPECGQIKTKKI